MMNNADLQEEMANTFLKTTLTFLVNMSTTGLAPMTAHNHLERPHTAGLSRSADDRGLTSLTRHVSHHRNLCSESHITDSQ